MVPVTVKIVESDDINAIAMPGGFLYVNTGLILATGTEAELAAVIAHEIAHVAARHATEGAAKARLFDFLSLPLIFAGGPAGIAIRQAGAMLISTQVFRFSRKAEEEADLLGMEYHYKSGYDPAAAVNFLEKLQTLQTARRNAFSEMFATHPPTEKRIRKLREAAATILPDRDSQVLDTSAFIPAAARLKRRSGWAGSAEYDGLPVLKRRTRDTN
jgi:predicted Zn-dependent protease